MGGWGCYGLAMADGLKERQMGLFRKGSNNEEGTNTKTVVASYHEQSQERRMGPFGPGTSSKVTTTSLIEGTQTAKATDLRVLMNPWDPFITETNKKGDSKEKMFWGVAMESPTLVKVEMSTFKDPDQPPSFHTVELEIKGLVDFSEAMDTEHFTLATTSHIWGHWKDDRNVKIYNVKTNFISTAFIGHSHLKPAMKRERPGCDSENTVVVQIQISIDFKIIDPKITEEMIIAGALGTSGTNKYVMTLKESCVESFSCIIKISGPVIIQLSTGPKHDFNLKTPRKLNFCTHCTDIETPWMTQNEKKCSTSNLLSKKCNESQFGENNIYFQFSCFRANRGYKRDDCCDYHGPKEKDIQTCIICTDVEPPWLELKGRDCREIKIS